MPRLGLFACLWLRSISLPRFREPRPEGQISASQVPYVTERLLSMAMAAREWHAEGVATGVFKTLTPSKLAHIFLPPGCEATNDGLRDKVSLLRKVVAALPKVKLINLCIWHEVCNIQRYVNTKSHVIGLLAKFDGRI